MRSSTRAASLPQHAAPRWLHPALRMIALGLAAVHTAVAMLQQSMNEDGIGYLDLGDAWLDGNPAAAGNGIWSPLYAWLVAAAVRVIGPSSSWEFPTVQAVNFLVYACALLAFGYFWRRLTAAYYAANGDGAVRFPPALWLVLGYSLFTWSSLGLIEIWAVTPDMAVAAVVYLAAGLMLQAADEPTGGRSMILLGLLLGLGFLVKAALLPLGLAAVLLTAMSTAGAPAERARRFLIAAAVLLLGAAPLIATLSWSAGHLTMGDVGRFTYLKHVNEMPYPDFHEALERLDGRPVHPPRRIFDEPPVYEFADPVGGTYPMAYDPGYWTEGLQPTITAAGQARALVTSGMQWFDLFVRRQGGFFALVLLLGWMSVRPSRPWWRIDAGRALVLWSLAAFGLYSLVYVEARYIAPFVVLFWAGLLLRLRFPEGALARRLALAGAVLLSLFVWINLAALHLDGLRQVTGFTPLDETATAPDTDAGTHAVDHPALADALAEFGLRPGDRVGVIGYAYSAYWARLARLRIVAEVHWQDQARFWEAPDAVRAAALEAFAAAGAIAVVAEPAAAGLPAGWMPIAETGYLIHPLRD
jgi:4-amino-4-deoxy-L-arabinose transferase-like glycosyltransferase